MNATFIDIAIGAVDNAASNARSPRWPGNYLMHVRLSHTPPQEWKNIYGAVQKTHYHSKTYRRNRIEGNYLIVDCPPVELNAERLAELAQDVNATNAKYRDRLQQREREAKARAQTKQGEHGQNI